MSEETLSGGRVKNWSENPPYIDVVSQTLRLYVVSDKPPGRTLVFSYIKRHQKR